VQSSQAKIILNELPLSRKLSEPCILDAVQKIEMEDRIKKGDIKNGIDACVRALLYP
jgi:hypothetical protein